MFKFLKQSLLITLYLTSSSLMYSQSVKTKATSDTISSSDTLLPDPDLFAKKWIGQPLPTFSLEDTQGKVYDNNYVKGKVIVLNFWSAYSIPCLDEMPYLSELVAVYANKDVVFLAPTVETLAQIQHAFTKSTFTFTILPQAKALFSTMDVNMLPTHIVIDKKGIINTVYIGLYRDSKTNQVAFDERLNSVIIKLLKD